MDREQAQSAAVMKRVGATELKNNLSAILRLVEAGEMFEVTRRGRPIALLVPIEANSRLPAHKVGAVHGHDPEDLDEPLQDEELPVRESWGWGRMADGAAMPNVVRAIRLSRQGH